MERRELRVNAGTVQKENEGPVDLLVYNNSSVGVVYIVRKPQVL
jgi:hypothetical protein